MNVILILQLVFELLIFKGGISQGMGEVPPAPVVAWRNGAVCRWRAPFRERSERNPRTARAGQNESASTRTFLRINATFMLFFAIFAGCYESGFRGVVVFRLTNTFSGL